MNNQLTFRVFSTAIFLLLSACGGGGGSGGTTTSSTTITSSASSSSSSLSSSQESSSSDSSNSSVYSANVDHLKDYAGFPIGVAVSATDSPSFNILTHANEQAVVEQHFSQMTPGNIFKVSYLHPTQDSFSWKDADDFVNYAQSKNLHIHGHTLVWHSSYQVPDFMKNWSDGPDNFITMLENHVTTIVNHFKDTGVVVSWDVVNEALNDNNPADFRTDSTFYIKSGNSAVYIEKAFQAARQADPSVTLYYNDYNLEQNGAKLTKLISMITDFKQRNIPIDGIGFQMHIFMDYPSAETLSAAFKKVVDTGLKVKLSELDIAVNNPYGSGWPANKISVLTQAVELQQKQRYCEVVKAYLDTVPVNQRGGIVVWGISDKESWLNGQFASQYDNANIAWPLLFDDNYNDKPALRGFADALQGAGCSAN